jgi:hypothetical protein
MRFPSAREVAEKLLCDRCLALIEGDGLYDIKIEDFCPKCRIKMGDPFTEMFRSMVDIEEETR